MLQEATDYYLVSGYQDIAKAFEKNDKTIIIQGVHFPKGLTISDFPDLVKTQFEKCIFEGNILISQNFSACFFTDCEFKGRLEFKKCELTFITKFTNCTFENEVVFEEFQTLKFVMLQNKQVNVLAESFMDIKECWLVECTIYKNDFLNDIFLPAASARHFSLTQGETNYIIYITGKDKPEAKDENDKKEHVSDIKLWFHFKGKTNFSIRNLKIYSLRISGTNKDCTLILKDLILDYVYIEDFSNHGIVKVYSVDSQYHYNFGQIHAYNSNFGKMELYDINFEYFLKVRLWHVNITEITPVNIIWCDYVKNIEYMLTDGDNFAQYKDIYRQLKSVMIRQHDKTQELAFQRNEMTMYWYQLKKNRGFRFSEYLILWTSKFSNDFGQSWLKPLGIIILLNLFLYNLVAGLLSAHFSFFHSVANIMEFINPVHDFRKLFDLGDAQVSGVARVIDGLARIVNSYLIFQLITAFRKFVR